MRFELRKQSGRLESKANRINPEREEISTFNGATYEVVLVQEVMVDTPKVFFRSPLIDVKKVEW